MVNVASSLIHERNRSRREEILGRIFLSVLSRILAPLRDGGSARPAEKRREGRKRVSQQRSRRGRRSQAVHRLRIGEGTKGILEEITRSKDDGGGGEVRVNRGFYKNYPQACGEAAVADWIGRIHLSSWELSTNVPHRASFPFNNNDSFVANCHNPRS